MTTIFLRSVKGSPLSTAEVDSNFSNLNTDKLEISEAVVSNTPNKVVKRDSAGNFSAGTITANLNGSLLGVPTAPTPLAGTNTTQIATTAFVIGERSNTATLTNKTISLGDNTVSGTTAQFNSALSDDNFAYTGGTLAQFASTTSAQLAGVISDETGTGSLVFANSPVLSGVPTAPTAVAGTNTTQIATTAFVQSAIPVLSVAGKTGAVTLNKADVGLANVDNTSDANKPVSTATQTAISTSSASAVNIAVATTLAAALGYNQTWQTVTRTSGVTYHNTTGKPIVLNVYAESNPGMTVVNASVTINGVTVKLCYGIPTSYRTSTTGSIIIPIDAYYVLNISGAVLYYCWELR